MWFQLNHPPTTERERKPHKLAKSCLQLHRKAQICVGRSPLHREGRRFEPVTAHRTFLPFSKTRPRAPDGSHEPLNSPKRLQRRP